MPSSEAVTPFVPLGGPPADGAFRPFGTPAPGPAPTPTYEPDPLALAFEAGRAHGRAAAAAGHAALAHDVAGVVAAVDGWREELRTRYAHTLVALALATARKIAGDALDAQPERWTPIVAAAVRSLVDREQVTIRVPSRLAGLLRAQDVAALAGDPSAGVRVAEDRTLADGSCIVESRMGDVDCSLDAQLDAVREALDAEGA